MKIEDFAKVVANALEVSAQAHPVRTDVSHVVRKATLHVMDKDQVLWRVVVEEPI